LRKIANVVMFHSNAQQCIIIQMCVHVKGITALEMAEGKPPYGDIHPMRVCIVLLRVKKLNNLYLILK